MLINRMVLKAPTRLFLAAALVAAQPSHAARPPAFEAEEQQKYVPPILPGPEDPDRPPAVQPYNDDFAAALNPAALARYAGMPVIGLDLMQLIGEESFGEEVPVDSMQALYLYDHLATNFPLVSARIEKTMGREKMFEAYQDALEGFRTQPHEPQRMRRMVCFVGDPVTNGYYDADEALDRLIVTHKCNTKYGALRLHKKETIPFRPQALVDALNVARNVAKINEAQIDDYIVGLMGSRIPEAQHMLLVTYVNHLGVRDAGQRNRLYGILNQRLGLMQAEMSRRNTDDMLDILHREFDRGQGITAYFAAAYLKSLVALNANMAAPHLRGRDVSAPLARFVSRADRPKPPAARIAPRW